MSECTEKSIASVRTRDRTQDVSTGSGFAKASSSTAGKHTDEWHERRQSRSHDRVTADDHNVLVHHARVDVIVVALTAAARLLVLPLAPVARRAQHLRSWQRVAVVVTLRVAVLMAASAAAATAAMLVLVPMLVLMVRMLMRMLVLMTKAVVAMAVASSA